MKKDEENKTITIEKDNSRAALLILEWLADGWSNQIHGVTKNRSTGDLEVKIDGSLADLEDCFSYIQNNLNA